MIYMIRLHSIMHLLSRSWLLDRIFGGKGRPPEFLDGLFVCIASAILNNSALCCKLGIDCSALWMSDKNRGGLTAPLPPPPVSTLLLLLQLPVLGRTLRSKGASSSLSSWSASRSPGADRDPPTSFSEVALRLRSTAVSNPPWWVSICRADWLVPPPPPPTPPAEYRALGSSIALKKKTMKINEN